MCVAKKGVFLRIYHLKHFFTIVKKSEIKLTYLLFCRLIPRNVAMLAVVMIIKKLWNMLRKIWTTKLLKDHPKVSIPKMFLQKNFTTVFHYTSVGKRLFCR